MTKKARKTGKRSLAVFMSILMLMSAWVFVAPTASANTTGLTLWEYNGLNGYSSNASTGVASGRYYINTNTTIKAKNNTEYNGGIINTNQTVLVYIPAGVTLTCEGGAGSGTNKGQGGLYLRDGATLIITGPGKLVAKGGKGGDGTDGGQGKAGSEGGWGGYGGAGGGAGIGGDGGDGGNRGNAGDNGSGRSWNGGNGGGGGNGVSGRTIYILDSITSSNLTKTNGGNGNAGSGGGVEDSGDWDNGGGGGGGGKGKGGHAIGSGGPGGGGGGGGGAGSGWAAGKKQGHGGGGGSEGGTNGAEAQGHHWSKYSAGSGGASGSYADESGNHIQDKTAFTAPDYAKGLVTFDKNGGSGGTDSAYQTIGYPMQTKDTKASGYPNITLPTRDGYDFDGYWTAASGGTKYINADGSSAHVYDYYELDLYAHWTEKDQTVTLNKQSGTGGTSTVYYTYNTNKYYSNSNHSTQITSVTLPTRTGYTFGGYYTETGGAGTQYITAAGAFTNNLYKQYGTNSEQTTRTLYAKWTINTSTLTVQPNTGTWSGHTTDQSYTQNYNTTKTISNPTAPDGKHFTGWTLGGDQNGSFSGTTYTFGAGNNKTDTLTAGYAVHTWDSGTITTQPTCTTAGVKTFHCTYTGCTATKTEAVGALGHDYTGDYVHKSEGQHYRKCARFSACGTYGMGTTQNETEACSGGTANCVDKAVCSKCSTAYGNVDLANHKTPENHAAVANSCETGGFTAGVYCTACNQWVSGHEPVAAKGHDYTGAVHSLNNGTHNWACKNNCGTYGKVENGTQVKDGTVGCRFGDWTADTATCLEGGSQSRTCEDCGYVETKTTSQLGHNWVETTEVTFDVNHLKTAATCEEDAVYYKSCSRCGVNSEETFVALNTKTGHDYTGTARDNGDGTHSWLCQNGCGTYGKVDNGTQVKDGKVAHTYGDWYDVTDANCKEEGSQTHKCSVCNKVETLPIPTNDNHDWDEGEITTPANCHDLGVKTFTCARCGSVKTEDVAIDPSNHKHLVRTAPVSNGCETDGNIEYWFCDGCGKYYSDAAATQQITQADTVIPAKGHDFSDTVRDNGDGTHSWLCKNGCGNYGAVISGTQVKDGSVSCEATYSTWSEDTADCVNGGTQSRTCSVCSHEETRNTNPLGHLFTKQTVSDATLYQAATCNSKAKYWYSCDRCGEIELDNDHTFESGEFDPNNHNFVFNRTVAPLCEADGYDLYICSRCQAEDQRNPVGQLGHLWGAWTSISNTQHKRTCERDANHTETEDHDMQKTSTVAPTCTEGGYDVFTCSVCGYSENRNPVAALGHDFTGAVRDNNNGSHSYKCTHENCNEYGVGTGASAEVNGSVSCEDTYSDWGGNTATCNEGGIETRTCSVCGHVDERQTQPLGHDLTDEVISEQTLYKDATCTEPAVYFYTCSRCGYIADSVTNTFTHGDPLGHDWQTPTYVWHNNNTAMVATTVCSRDRTHEITEDATVTRSVTKEPTCTEKGIATYTATFQNPYNAEYDYTTTFATQTTTSDVNTIPHKTTTHVDAVAPTCTEPGNIEYWICEVCGGYFTDVGGYYLTTAEDVVLAIVPDAHDYGPWTPNGEEGHTKVCSYNEEHNLSEGHKWANIVSEQTKATNDGPICENGEAYYKTCSECGYISKTEIFTTQASGHKLVYVPAVAPTCTEAGTIVHYQCGACGKYFSDAAAENEITDISVPATGHDFTGAYKDNGDGTHSRLCVNGCGTYGATADHAWTEQNAGANYAVNGQEADCLNEGHYYYSCVCGACENNDAHTFTAGGSLGHVLHEIEAVAVQCEADGNKAYSYCSVCDTILTLDGVDVSLNGWTKSGNANVYTITQTGHAYGDPTWTWNDDHTSATATRICANDPTHTDTMTDNEIHSVIVDKTHTTDGKATYTAEVTFAYDNKTFTDVVEIVDTASGHHTTKVDAKDATCEAAGNLEYWICNDEGCGKLFKDENALVETTLDAVTLEALGHNYVNPTWTWTQNGNFYTGATLTFTCANNAAHKQTPAVTFTADQTNPDCTNAGKIVYTATATFEGKTYTDTKEVALEKTGHTLTATAAKNATCEEAGNIAYWTCSVCNKIFSDENARYEITAADTVIAALGHTYNYANASYNWSTDHSSCTATATCIRCDATDTETKASTNNVKIPATCEAQGIRIYTVDFDNENFATQTYDELIPANGHGTAAMHEGKAATCEAAGFEAYWTCSVCGKLFKAETLTAENEIANPIVIPAKGHDWNYETVVYTWSETEPYTCTATVTCKNDGNHTKDVTGSVTITASTEADCTTDGSRTYTATFPADSNIPTDTKTATTPALGHDFSESIDRAHVVDGTHHNYKCVRCNAYGIGTGESAEVNGSVACTFHGDWLVSENETCTEPGSEWRKCGFCSNKETREREALSHQVFSVDAKDATCVAIGNKAYTYCERCGLLLTVDGVSVEEQNIKFNAPEAIALYKTEDMLNHDLTATAAKAATCEEDGNIAYWTCERCGKIFNTATPTSNEAAIALVDTVLPATKHDFTGAVRDNDDNTHSKKCTKCDAYGIMVNGTPVKDGKEACYGGTATCTDAAICSVCGHAYQAKLGHNYVLQSWTWNGYTAATAHYVCTNNTTHTKDVEATVNKTDATVTCTAAGQNTYVATATFTDGDKTYTDTDTKTEVVNATGHNWDFEHPVYSWDANQNCTVTLKCLNDEDHVYTEIGKNTTETTPATCEGTGSVKYTATFTINSTLTSTHTETLAALGHKWGDPAWTWTGNDTDGYTATVKLVCDRVASHEATPDVTVTKETVAPTCEKDGRIVYTATATLDGRTYKDTKITIQPAKGHDWQAPVFTWTQAENGGYSAATALIACNNDPAHNQTLNCALTTETDNATCTEGGIVTYTATVTFNGRTYTETKTAEVTALGHKYEFVDFTWTGNDNDGYTAAVANFKCANDPTHTTTAAATVTTEKVDAICEADGKTTYTATVSFEGKDYTDEKVVVIPMLHHNWGTATYTWVKDGDQYKVTALRVCANNPEEHQQTVTVTTTSEILSGSGCETEGTVKYTATFASPFETQTREETVGVAGHTLVHVERKEPACEAAGNIEYWKCSVCGKMFDNDTGTGLTLDENAIAIPALGHNFVMAKGVAVLKANNDDLTHSFKCSRCDAYGAVINGEHKTEAEGGKMTHSYGAAIVTQNPTCTVPGEQQETCTLCGYVHTAVIEKTSHVLFKIDAKSPTCTKEGNKTYYYCSVCGQFFSDKDGQNPTSKEAMTIAKLGHDYTGAYHDNGDGTHSRACVNGCGTYGEKSAHTFDEAQSAATLCSVATCTKPATYYKSCSICGAKDSTVFTAGTALGHKMIAFTGQDASCTQDGHTAYTECERCHLREGYNVLKSTGHGAYQYNAEKSGSTADGSLKWSCYVCENGCGDYYMTLTVTSIDAQGTRVPNVNVSIYNADRSVNIQGTTDGNGDFVVPNEIRNRLKTGTYTVALEYVRDGSNYNTSGTIKVANGTITGSYGKLTPYGGNASGSIGGEPTGEFRCSMCSTYESAKNVPVYGWFISIIHFFVHMISRIGK